MDGNHEPRHDGGKTQRYRPIERTDEDALTEAMIQLASEYGRYGYRRITALLQEAGWQVGKDRVQRIWRREGLKVPQKQRPRGRLWFNDGSCIRLRPERANHVWSYDFVSARTHDGRTIRMLTLLDEFTRERLAIRVARRLGRYEVIEALADVMLFRGILEHIPSRSSQFRIEPVRESRRPLTSVIARLPLRTAEGTAKAKFDNRLPPIPTPSINISLWKAELLSSGKRDLLGNQSTDKRAELGILERSSTEGFLESF